MDYFTLILKKFFIKAPAGNNQCLNTVFFSLSLFLSLRSKKEDYLSAHKRI